jgi:replication initiation and membrane attachment protein DnaB
MQNEALDMDSLPAMTENLIFRTANEFSLYVEMSAVKTERTCTDVILSYCEMRDLDPNDISRLVSTSLREKIKIEMQEMGLMPRTSTLEFE